MNPSLGLIAFLMVCACSHPQTELFFHETLEEDPEAKEIIRQSYRQGILRKNFDTIFRVEATYLSQSWKTVMEQRREKLNLSLPSIPQDGTSWFIGLYAPDRELMDLNNGRLWSLIGETQEQKFFPVHLEEIHDKSWDLWVPKTDLWTRKFLVTFPFSQDEEDVHLTLTNGEGSIRMHWLPAKPLSS